MASSMSLVFSVALVVVVGQMLFVSGEDIKECSPAKDGVANGCTPDVECCIPEMEFFKMSRREIIGEDAEPLPELINPILPWGNSRQGRCIPYFTERENCYAMATWQTCGCAAGLTCQYTPHPDEEMKRAIPPWLRPKGKHACIKA